MLSISTRLFSERAFLFIFSRWESSSLRLWCISPCLLAVMHNFEKKFFIPCLFVPRESCILSLEPSENALFLFRLAHAEIRERHAWHANGAFHVGIWHRPRLGGHWARLVERHTEIRIRHLHPLLLEIRAWLRALPLPRYELVNHVID